MNAVNITVPFLHNGVHYAGLSIHNGVDFELIDAPCGAGRQLIKLIGAEIYPDGIFWDAVSAVNADEPAHPLYLQIVPASSSL
jgi:hypothetical protein